MKNLLIKIPNLKNKKKITKFRKKTNVKKFKEQIKTPIRIYFVVEDHEIFR